MNESVLEFARKNGYQDVKYIGEWQGYKVYDTIYDDEVAYIGLPFFILEKDSKLRMTTPDECFDVLDYFDEE